MTLEFVPYDDPYSVLASTWNVTAVPRKGDKVHIQTEKKKPFGTYTVELVEWQLDASDSFGAIVHVRPTSGFGE